MRRTETQSTILRRWSVMQGMRIMTAISQKSLDIFAQTFQWLFNICSFTKCIHHITLHTIFIVVVKGLRSEDKDATRTRT